MGLRLVMTLAVLLLAFGFARVWWPDGRLTVNIGAFVSVIVTTGLLPLLMIRGTWSSQDPLLDAEQVGRSDGLAGADVGAGLPLSKALRMPELWLLLLIGFVGMGSGLVVLNNAGQMVDSFGPDAKATTMFVSLISIANCFGRITFGLVPDLFSHVPRPLFCAANVVIMGGAQSLLAIGGKPAFFAGGIITGFSYGGFWTLMPTLVVEIFGTSTFATLYNFQSLAVSASSLTFSTFLAGHLYDREAILHPAAAGGCSGPTCYRTTCLVMVAACAVGFFASLMLLRIMKRHVRSSSAGLSLAVT